MHPDSSLRSILRRDIAAPCIVIFLCDVTWNMLAPTLSIYATSLGASLPMVGALNSVTGFVILVLSLPAGVYGDRAGRKRAMQVGAAFFLVSAIGHAAAPSAVWLFPARVLFAIGVILTFPIGSAYIADVTQPRERGLAFGLLTTAMGLGSVAGGFLSALLTEQIGLRGVQMAAGAATALALLLATLLLRRTNAPATRHAPPFASMLPLLRNRAIVFACVIQLLVSTLFAGLTIPLFPLLAQARGASTTLVSSMFSLRAFASMLLRIPFGVLSNRVPRMLLMQIALIGLALALLLIGMVDTLPAMALLLALEGIAFGLHITVGQAAATEMVGEHERGAAIGLLSTAGGLASMAAPLLLGALADRYGIAPVMRASALLALGALGLAWFALARKRAQTQGHTQ